MDIHLQLLVPPQSRKSEDHHEGKEPGELLDESWFFDNLLDRKPRMSRCLSDSSMLRGKSMEETFSTINALVECDETLLLKGLQKTPSLPPAVKIIKQESSDHKAETTERNDPVILEPLRRKSLLRAPSLPVFAGTEDDDDDDDESDFCMGKLIRQASLNQSKLLLRQRSLNHPRVLPPRQTPKGVMTRSCSISALANQKPEPDMIPSSVSSNDPLERKSTCAQNHSSTRKGHFCQDIDNNLQGFKNMGLNSLDKEKVSRRLGCHPAEAAWRGKSLGPPPLHGRVASRKSAEDMKAQIKFWARTVASNVHQEC